MPVEITDLSSLNATDVQQNLALLKSYLAVDYPNLDLEPGGVLHSLLLRPAAIFHTLNQSNMTRLRQSQSLLAIAQDPTLADDSIVDAVLSNFNVQRNTGGKASGTISIFFATDDFVAIPSSTTFTANGFTFQPVNGVFGVTSGSTGTNNVVFIEQSDNTFVLNVPVVALEAGAAGNLSKGTNLVLTSSEFPNYITAQVASDFDGGKDAETNTDLLAKLVNGVASPSLASRTSIKALLQNNFSNVLDVSAIGAGDVEMLRDGHSTLGVKSLGKVDIYVRTRTKPLTIVISKDATVIDATNKIFHLNFTRDEYPGLYTIDAVVPLGSNMVGTLPINYITRDTDTAAITGVDFTPTMVGSESAFTRYQTVEVEFVSDVTNTTGLVTGDKVTFNVTLTYMPDIDKIHDWISNRARRSPGGDYLVKAPIPCFVGVGMRIIVGVGDQSPDLEAIKAAVIDAVNNTTFAEGQLDSSVIINAAQALLPRKSRVETPLDLRGRVIRPDGTETWIFDQHKLTVPTIPSEMISPRTVSFFLGTSDIIVEAIPSNALPV